MEGACAISTRANVGMIKKIINWYWKHKLKNYQCKLALGVSSLNKGSRLDLESNVRIGKVILDGKHITVGAYTYIRSGSELNGDCTLGRFCSIGQNVIIGLKKNKHPTDWLTTSLFSSKVANAYQDTNEPTIIGNDCWIGRGAIIMSGVTIGNGAVIGAQALVTKDVPPYAVVVGVPAKIIKHRFSSDLIDRLNSSQWWTVDAGYLAELNISEPESCLGNLSDAPKAIYSNLRLTRKGVFLISFKN